MEVEELGPYICFQIKFFAVNLLLEFHVEQMMPFLQYGMLCMYAF